MGGGQGRRRRSALESALQSLEQGVLCPARTWTDGRTAPRRARRGSGHPPQLP